MRVYRTLVRRELGTFFVSWSGYVVMAVVLLIIGIGFCTVLEQMRGRSSPQPITEIFTPFFWMALIPSAPVITMRLFSQEKATGTFETLMTAPVGDWEVVLAKFSSAFVFYLLMWLPLLAGGYALKPLLKDPGTLELEMMASTYLGILLIGSVYLAIGTFASALSRSQLNAAMVSFGIGAFLFLVGIIALNPPLEKNWPVELFDHVSMISHMQDFARGIVDTRHVVFYLSLTWLFLYLAHKVIESRRWK